MMECGVLSGENTLHNEEGRKEGGTETQGSDNREKQEPQVATLLVVENKQTTVQVETILVPQRHTLKEVYEGGGTKTDLVGAGGQHGGVQAVEREQRRNMEQQTRGTSALGCEEQHNVDNRGAGIEHRVGLMEEVNEEEDRGEDAVVQTPEHSEAEVSDTGAVNDSGGNIRGCARALLDTEGYRQDAAVQTLGHGGVDASGTGAEDDMGANVRDCDRVLCNETISLPRFRS